MQSSKKLQKYERIRTQLVDLLEKSDSPQARMATITALLHHKFETFFWTGFYTLHEGELTVGPYQGPLACLVLQKDTGVCWAGLNQQKTLVVPNVHEFPGHIACDSRSNSEIVVPLKNAEGAVIGVLDVDSQKFEAFDEEDAKGLESIVQLVYG